MSNNGPIAQRWALFFCSMWLSLALLGFLFIDSCSHAEVRHVGEGSPPNAEATYGEPAEGSITPEGSSAAVKKYNRRNFEETEAELDRVQQENSLLKEENWWLRTEILKLQESLADANQNIYSLHRKLDAIFKPNNVAE